jgi:type II secretory pathway pseudopilin PulG
VRRFVAFKRFNIFGGNQTGVGLIETIIALAVLSLIAAAFLSGLSTAFRAVMVSEESVTAESLAKSQLEFIKAQDYITVADYDPNTPGKCYELIDIPDALVDAGYDIEISPPETIISPGESGFELQSITLAIRRNGEGMLTISGYKVGR